jgi:acetyltransferase-like isoleucine patch superfamily enzyme
MKINTLIFYKIKLNTFFWTIYNLFKLKYLWRIQIDKSCTFNGNLNFWKAIKSNIMIGSNCIFISNSNSRNLVGINRPCTIITQNSNAQIIIGSGSGFSGTVISSSKSIIIGNNVKCGGNTQIMDNDWHPEDPRSGDPKSIIIHDNVWLGLNVTVMKGVTIGKNTVIGVNSVVTKSIPQNVMAAGNPCKVIKELK